MPPVRKRKSTKGRSAPAKRRSTRRYPTSRRKVQTRRRPRRKTTARKRNGSSMLAIRTLQPKELIFTVPYRQTIFFSDMGAVIVSTPDGTGGTTYFTKLCSNMFTLNMSDPLRPIVTFQHNGDPTTGAPQYIVSNQKKQADGTIQPVNTLLPELEHYFEGHKKMTVVASTAWVQYTQMPGQGKLDTFANQAAQGSIPGEHGSNAEWSTNHPPFMGAQAHAQYDGNVYAALVKHRPASSVGNIDNSMPIGATNATLHDLKTSVPGMRMKNILCHPHTNKSVRFTSTYTPKSALGISDWRDNSEELSFTKEIACSKNMLTTAGIFNATPPAKTGTAAEQGTAKTKCPEFKLEILVNYRIVAQRRNNIFQNNLFRDVPLTPHAGEL